MSDHIDAAVVPGALRSYLEGAPALADLPTDRPRRPIADQRYGTVAVSTDGVVFDRQHLLAAVAGIVVRYTGQDEIIIGESQPNGDIAVVRLEANDSPLWSDWVDRCTSAMVSASHIAPEALVLITPNNIENMPAVHVVVGSLEPAAIAGSGLDLVVHAPSVDSAEIAFAEDRFDRTSVERLAMHLVSLLREAYANPHTPCWNRSIK